MSPVEEIQRRPIARERLEQAIAAANLPSLLMVLVQLTGDRRWLAEPYRPGRPRGLDPNDSGGFSDDVAADVRSAAVEAVSAWSEGAEPAIPTPDPELLLEMLSACVGEDVPAEYQQMMSEDMGFTPAVVEPASSGGSRLSAVIVGAGIAGLTTALRLREAGIPYVILERNLDVGGVWLTNTYPGAGVDTPSYLYSYSFFPRAWGSHFSKRDEVLDYVRAMADSYDLRREVQFGVEVGEARFDEGRRRWTVSATGPDGEELTFEPEILITAVGLFNQPAATDLPGSEKFAGDVFHSTAWPDDVDLRGRRVAVVGSGATAMQVVPAIVDEVESLTIVQRSAQWVSPYEQYFSSYSEDVRRLVEHVPFYRAWYRYQLAWIWNDRVVPTLKVDPDWTDPERSVNAANDGQRQFFTRYLEEQLAGREDLIEKSLPDYPPFGKRMLLDNGWFEALKREHVHLVSGSATELTEGGVRSDDGVEHPADVVILCTGFAPRRFLGTLDVRGREGRRLRDVWGEEDAAAHLGITVPGFPNLFIVYGPNSSLGAGGSQIYVLESAARYAASLIALMSKRDLAAVECRTESFEKWVAEVDGAHAEMVWTHPGMSTYSRNASGRVVTSWPWRVVDYWRVTRNPDLADFVVEPASEAPAYS